jgi:hypothetical protein
VGHEKTHFRSALSDPILRTRNDLQHVPPIPQAVAVRDVERAAASALNEEMAADPDTIEPST